MLLTDLPNPGVLTNAMQLRKEVTKAINAVELSGNAETRASLVEFLRAALARLPTTRPPKAKKTAE